MNVTALDCMKNIVVIGDAYVYYRRFKRPGR